MSEALVAFLGVMLAASVGLYSNFRNAKELRKQPFLTKQLTLCIEASEIAAIIATTVSQDEFDRAHARFRVLFWGPLSIVENTLVSDAMVRFRIKLKALISEGSPLPLNELEQDSYQIASEVRKLVLTAWRITNLQKEIERKLPARPWETNQEGAAH